MAHAPMSEAVPPPPSSPDAEAADDRPEADTATLLRAPSEPTPRHDEAAPSRDGARCAWICVGTVLLVALLMVVGFLANVMYRSVVYGSEVYDVGPVASSPTDDRSFAYIRLDNGLQVMLVSDPDAEIGGAALDVRAGSWYDPADYPGLAHAVEHCLFLGTLKYPGEAEYNAYLAAHGGSSNAYTDGEDT